MVELIWTDDSSLIAVTSTYLPDMHAINVAWPRRSRHDPLDEWGRMIPPDAALATVLNALARRSLAAGLEVPAAARGIHEDLSLDTYVFRGAVETEPELEHWFARRAGSADYRVIMHRQPGTVAGQEVPYLWRQAYRDARLCLRRDHERWKYLRAVTAPFVERVMHAYGRSDAQLQPPPIAGDYLVARRMLRRLPSAG